MSDSGIGLAPLAILLTAASGLLAPAAAAVAATPPTPGMVQETLKSPPKPALRAAPAVAEPAPAAARKAPPGGAKVRVERFNFRGNTLFSTDELHAQIADWEGRELTLEEIYKVSDLLTDFYHRAGYSLAIVTVPAQKVSRGEITLEVIEGRVSALLFKGNRGYSDAFLGGQFDQVRPGEPLRFQALEHELMLLNDLPGLVARSVIGPGAQYGTSQITLNMEETPYGGEVTVDNYGTKSVGEWRLSGSVAANNPLGWGDVLALAATHSESGLLDSGNLSYGIPLGSDGMRVTAAVSSAGYEVGGALRPLAVTGETSTARADLTYPLLRSRKENLQLGLAVSHTEAESDSLGVRIVDNQLTLLEGSAVYSFVHGGNAVTSVGAQLSSNFRPNPAGLTDDAQPGKLDLTLSHDRPLGEQWRLSGRGELVTSLDPLMDIQKFSIGGPQSARGFDTATIRGDQGLFLSAEASRPLALVDGVPTTFRLFADGGVVYRMAPAATEKDSDHLADLGLGMQLAPGERYRLDLQWAMPVEQSGNSAGIGNGAFWLKATAGF